MYENLVKQLGVCTFKYQDHRRAFHHGGVGTCGGGDNCPPDPLQLLEAAIQKGSQHSLKLTAEVLNSVGREELQKLVETPADYEGVNTAIIDDVKRLRKEFAENQKEMLREIGVDSRKIERITAVAGPGRSVKSVKWGQSLAQKLGRDAALLILRGYVGAEPWRHQTDAERKCVIPFGKERCVDALKDLGVEVPDVENGSAEGLYKIFCGALAFLK